MNSKTPFLSSAETRKTLSGTALLRDMAKYRRRVTKDKASARKFLTELGVLTPEGKLKTLIRD